VPVGDWPGAQKKCFVSADDAAGEAHSGDHTGNEGRGERDARESAS